MALQAFICPITREIMIEPVLCIDGHTFEKEAILAWFATGHISSPLTGKVSACWVLRSQADLLTQFVTPHGFQNLGSKNVTPNHALRNSIEDFLKRRPELKKLAVESKDLEIALRLREEEVQALIAKHTRGGGAGAGAGVGAAGDSAAAGSGSGSFASAGSAAPRASSPAAASDGAGAAATRVDSDPVTALIRRLELPSEYADLLKREGCVVLTQACSTGAHPCLAGTIRSLRCVRCPRRIWKR